MMVIDTNVAVVANGHHNKASPECVGASIRVLELVREHGIVIDDGYRIFDEYKFNLRFSGQPGLGDLFLKWVWTNIANAALCAQVVITESHDEWTFEEFPHSPDLLRFDVNDRKFVAVVVAYGGSASVFNASDRDWREFQLPLNAAGVHVEFVCPELMVAR